MAPRTSDVDANAAEQEMIDILESTSDLSNRVSDIKNRMELHRMLAEYEKQNRLMQAQPENYYEVLNEEEMPTAADYEEIQSQQQQPLFFQREFRRPGSHFKEREDEIANGERLENLLEDLRENQLRLDEEQQQAFDDDARSTSFREVAKNEHIPPTKMQRYQMEDDVVPTFFNGKNEHHSQKFDYDDTEANELPTVYLSPRDQLAGFREDTSPEDGVYTEGGLVYVPNAKNDATTSLLQSIMGFQRRERLDVKKPGPQPPQPPPSSQSPNEAPKLENLNLEQLPAHMTSDGPKAKKQVHSDLDHANYSVDTEYAHVILKNSIDNWKDGVSGCLGA